MEPSPELHLKLQSRRRIVEPNVTSPIHSGGSASAPNRLGARASWDGSSAPGVQQASLRGAASFPTNPWVRQPSDVGPRRPSGANGGSASFTAGELGPPRSSTASMPGNLGTSASGPSSGAAQWSARNVVSAPANVDRRGGSLTGGGMVLAGGGDRNGNGNSRAEVRRASPVPGLERHTSVRVGSVERMERKDSKNDVLMREVEKAESKFLMQDAYSSEMRSWNEERDMLLVETNKLLEETEIMSVHQRELENEEATIRRERSALSLEAEEVCAYGRLTTEVRELKSERELSRKHNSELDSDTIEKAASSHSTASQQVNIENQAMRMEVQRLSQQVERDALEKQRFQADLEQLRAELAQSRLREAEEPVEKQNLQSDEMELLRADLARARQAETELRAQVKMSDDVRSQITHDAREARTQAKQLEDELQAQVKEAAKANARLLVEKTEMNTSNSELMAQLKSKDAETELLLEASQSLPHSTGGGGGGGSEGRLRQLMTTVSVTSEDLGSAIGAVEALVGEARRELERAQHRERRAAFELLGAAIDKADEDLIETALVASRKAGLDDIDITRGEAKLTDLRSMSDEQKAAKVFREVEAKRKKEAFLLVKKDDAEKLREFIEALEEGVRWMDWRDYAGRTLWKCAQEMRVERVKVVLTEILDIRAPAERNKLRGWKDAAARAERGRTSTVASIATIEARKPSGSFHSDGSRRRESIHGEGGDEWRPRADTIRASISFENLELKNLETLKASDSFNETSPLGSSGRCSMIKNLLLTDKDEGSTSSKEEPSLKGSDDADAKPELTEAELAELRTKAFRSVVQDDPSSLEACLDRVPKRIWCKWENKAGKDLITLSEERGSSEAYGVLAKALDMIQEQKRDFYEEREAVWIYIPGEVQPRRATVLEDTPEANDEVLIEYWDGDDPASYVDRAMVRKDYF